MFSICPSSIRKISPTGALRRPQSRERRCGYAKWAEHHADIIAASAASRIGTKRSPRHHGGGAAFLDAAGCG